MYVRAVTADSDFNGFYVPQWAELNNRGIFAIYVALVLTLGSEPVNAVEKEGVK